MRTKSFSAERSARRLFISHQRTQVISLWTMGPMPTDPSHRYMYLYEYLLCGWIFDIFNAMGKC